jgi:hypothetical protein
MMASAKKKTISLLTEKPLEITLKGRIISWLLKSGRVVVVLTELIVIMAFFSRFWLDRRNTDLSERIRQYQVILASTSEFEKEFRNFRQRLNKSSKKLAEEKDLSVPLKIVAQEVPKGVVLSNFSFKNADNPSASLSVVVYSERGLFKFIRNLTGNDKVDSIRVGAIKKEKLSSGININITVNFKDSLYE